MMCSTVILDTRTNVDVTYFKRDREIIENASKFTFHMSNKLSFMIYDHNFLHENISLHVYVLEYIHNVLSDNLSLKSLSNKYEKISKPYLCFYVYKTVKLFCHNRFSELEIHLC